jgi:hypothetical protein
MFQQLDLERGTISATPSTYPTTSPSIFCSFLEGALGLANPLNAFSFHWLFCFHSLSNATLISSKVPDLAVGNLKFLYLATDLPRFNSLDRYHSLFYNMEIENMAWSRLDCWTSHQNWVLIKTDTDIAFLGKYEIFAFVKAEHIWTFDIQSWNMKPIGIGI